MSWQGRVFIDKDTKEEVRILLHNYGGKGIHLTMRKQLTEKQIDAYFNGNKKKNDNRI